MKACKDNPNLEVVFNNDKGTLIYSFKDVSMISAYRGVSAEKAKRFAGMAITKEELGRLLGKALSGLNSKQPDIGQLISIVHEVNWRLQHICEENSLLELAYIYLLLEGEDDEHPSDEWNKKKAELVKQNLDIRGFFLRTALQLASSFSQKPGVDLLTYLEETKGAIQTRMARFSE